jgi:hypothetical protein
MNGFTERRTSDASEQAGGRDRVLTWGAATAMLPLVRRIAADVVGLYERLTRLQPERERLERRRRDLAWPDRARRYQLQDEAAAAEKERLAAAAELDALGVALLHAPTGLVGFPTVVNDRPAYFSWKPGEDALAFWNYADDLVRRPVPHEWTRPPAPRGAGKGRSKSQK